MQRIGFTLAILLMASTAFGQVRVVSPEGHSLEDLVGTDRLVTVVLTAGPRDANLEVVEIGPSYLAVRDANGARHSYLFDHIAEVRVQEDTVEERRFVLDESRALTADEQNVVNRAMTRAQEIFNDTTANQPMRMDAAALLALDGNREAREYLHQRARSNDLQTALDAAQRLYLVQDDTGAARAVENGLNSGNRQIRAQAAKLAGLLQFTQYEDVLLEMTRNRLAEISAPAARALARMGSERVKPILYEMLGEISSRKNEAAIFGLTELGGEDVIAELRRRLDRASGATRFRIIKVLHKLGDFEGTQLLRDAIIQTPTVATEAAILLARDGDFEGRDHLNARLNERYNPYEEVFIRRAEMVAALIEGEDRRAIAELQELLRTERSNVDVAVLNLIARVGMRSLMPLTQLKIDSANNEVALAAAQAATAVANPGFRRRLQDVRL